MTKLMPLAPTALPSTAQETGNDKIVDATCCYDENTPPPLAAAVKPLSSCYPQLAKLFLIPADPAEIAARISSHHFRVDQQARIVCDPASTFANARLMSQPHRKRARTAFKRTLAELAPALGPTATLEEDKVQVD